MKFNPYAALVTTGALMLATVVFVQSRSSIALVKAGVVSVDRDVSSFAATVLASSSASQERNTWVAAGDSRMPGTRVASAEPRDRMEQE